MSRPLKLDERSSAIDFRTWIALKRIELPRPPYALDFQVTPHSFYGDPKWYFEKADLAHGSKMNGKLLLLRQVSVANGQTFALGSESLLMTQLKDTIAGYIFHRAYLGNRVEVPRAASLVHEGRRLLILYSNIGANGFKSVGDLDPSDISEIFRKIKNASSVHDQLIGHFEDILKLSREGLITDGPTGTKYHLSYKLVPKPFFAKSKTRTLEDEETSFVILRSLEYIDKAEQIISKISEYDNLSISNTSLREWAYANLSVNCGLENTNVRNQLIWLIRISAYNLLSFHLGSRACEALSSTGCSIEVKSGRDGLDEVYVWLTIVKGSGGKGLPRRYRVHPFFIRIFAALRLLNDQLGMTIEDYLFKGADIDEISGSNLLTKVRRFVTMHGGTFEMSTHTWRFTLSDIVVGTVRNPYVLLAERLGHKHISESIGYGLHGPSGEKLREAARIAAADAVDAFVLECEESNLGGAQGLRINDALTQGRTSADLRSDLTMLGIVPVAVARNKFCLKRHGEVGPCGSGSNPTRREIAKCRDDCTNQVQIGPEREFWFEFIDQLPNLCSDTKMSILEKVRLIARLEQNLTAWPELKNRLNEVKKMNPVVRAFF